MRQIGPTLPDQGRSNSKRIVEARGVVGHAPNDAEPRRIEFARAPAVSRSCFEGLAEGRLFEATVAGDRNVLFGYIGVLEGRFAAGSPFAATRARRRATRRAARRVARMS